MNENASEKQMELMEKLGIPCPAGIGKKPASDLIKKQLEGNKAYRVAESVPANRTRAVHINQFSGKEFHLTPEQCRSNALSSAIEVCRARGESRSEILKVAKEFEAYIVTGE